MGFINDKIKGAHRVGSTRRAILFAIANQQQQQAEKEQKEREQKALQGTKLDKEGNAVNANNTGNNNVNSGENTSTGLLNLKKKKENAISESGANQNPVVSYSQGQIVLG